MNTTRAIRFERTGGPEVLGIATVPLAAPGPREVLVRHHAIGVNFIDCYHRSGLYPVPLPAGLGNDAVGVIEALGAEVDEFTVGDRVASCSGPRGAYAEARVVPAAHLVRVPDTVADTTAAAAMLKGMTAEYLVRRLRPIAAGETVLFHSAAGGVGSIACQWLRATGVDVIGTVGSDTKVEVARANGCREVIVRSREDFAARARELTDAAGVSMVFDSIGKDTMLQSLDCLQPRGMLVLFGNASGKPEPFDPMLLSQKGSLFLTRPSLHEYVAARTDLVAAAKALFDVIARGAVKIAEPRVFPLADAAAAHRALESGTTTGSTILVP